MRKVLHAIDTFFDNVGILFLFLLFLFTVIQVFFRYVLNNPLPWPEEIACYFFIWITYIGLTKNIREENHFKIDLLLLVLSPKNKTRVTTVFYFLILFFLVVTGLGSISLLRANQHILSANFISVNVVYASLPLMSIFMIIHLVILIVNKFRILANTQNTSGNSKEK